VCEAGQCFAAADQKDSLEQNLPTRSSDSSVSAALAAARDQDAAAQAEAVKFPGEDGGQSLAEMAQQDLDAALQLLADRAQYITGASGTAIALRRDGRKDMLCRASSGESAPELGALLSAEFGLSGESVRTGQVLLCEDTANDARVNREVCRELGIASVVVVPVVNDEGVLGVFELFSDTANVFGHRDVAAVQRLAEMVETAVRLARAAEKLPEQLRLKMTQDAAAEPVADGGGVSGEAPGREAGAAGENSAGDSQVSAAAAEGSNGQKKVEEEPAEEEPVEKLLWPVGETGTAELVAEPDESYVPPVLRGIKKCHACGFPISEGRELCVGCEEKKWRGQLRPASAQPSSVAPVEALAKTEQAETATAAVVHPVAASTPAGAGEEQPADSGEGTGKVEAAQERGPELIFSAAAEPQESWIGANKFVIGTLLIVAAAIAAAAYFLR
jgi:hypothetical protein